MKTWRIIFDQVQSVLKDAQTDEVMQLVVCNKIDLLEDVTPRIEYNDAIGKPSFEFQGCRSVWDDLLLKPSPLSLLVVRIKELP